MPLLSFTDVSLAYGHHPLLDRVAFQIDKGERVCLVGRNGAGKSTLFRVIAGEAEPDAGELWRSDTLRLAYLPQDLPTDARASVFETVAEGLGDLGALLAEYHGLAREIEAGEPAALTRLAELQQRIETEDGWNLEQKVQTVISRLGLDETLRLADCSGGMRRRVLLARALVSEPDLLLLDEPTNHLDIAAITWLEEFLKAYTGALIFITHDRSFLRNLATRIVELDRGVLSSFPGNFDRYLQRKAQMLEAETKANARFDKALAEHEVWIRQGIKARRTRNEGRVRRLQEMRRQRAQRLERQGRVRMQVEAGEDSGRIVADLRDVRFAYAGRPVIEGLSTRVLRGDRVGILGPNGAGKSTLLRIILGELRPQGGRVVLGTRLEAAYFDQERGELELEKSVRHNLSGGSDYVQVRGRRRHVIGYLRDFLFPPERIDSPVQSLSGGERNRLLLAKILLARSNLLVLDEPTNDLDVETLELLEDLLADYEGTLLVVSHDRAFLDNVVTSLLVFEGDGRVGEYVGGYEDYLRQRGSGPAAAPAPAEAKDPAPAPTRARPPGASRAGKLSYKDQRELDALPGRIEALEGEVAGLEARISAPEFYRQDDSAAISATLARLESMRAELDAAYARWEQLEAGA